MKPSLASSTLILFAIGGCAIRHPVGGCPYEDVNVSPQEMTPWGTVLEQDMAQLVGPYRGRLSWFDGDDVITVPKAGQAIEVDAEIEIEPTTSRVREYESTKDQPACEVDYLLMDATVTFVRPDDGQAELAVPIEVIRYVDSMHYIGSAETTPVSEFVPGLAPMEDLDVEFITTMMWWRPAGTALLAEFEYTGQTVDSSSTGHGRFKDIAEFTMPGW
jgi:hypothetical protein